jgi:hypothetical protein
MKINKTLTALIAGASLGMSGQAMALGTQAGTEIKNEVTLTYAVSSAPQSDVTGSAQFKVDNKIDMSLTWDTAALKTVAPGVTVFHKFTLTNTGNLDQDYDLGAAVAALTSTIIAGSPNVDVTASADVTPTFTFYDALTEPSVGDSTVTSLAAVPHSDAGDLNQKIFWAGVNYPLTANVVDADILGNYVTVTADVTGNGNNNATDKNANLEEQLFVNADGAGPNDIVNDAAISAIFGDTITTANFEDSTDGLKLSVVVVNDPICNDNDTGYGSAANHVVNSTGIMNCASATAPASYTPKAIPGALVEYTITASNTGQSDADLVEFAQDLSTLTFADVSGVDLRANSLDHVAAAMTGNTDTPVDASTNTALSVTVATFEASAAITITFTAIVD